MNALFFREHGGLDVIQYGDVPDPTPGPGEVLVRVRACAINHLDIWVRRGWPGLGRYIVQGVMRRDFPVIQGSVLFMAVIFILVNLAVDLSYGFIDPRVRGMEGRK